LFGVWNNQGTKLPIGPTLAFGLRHGAAFLGQLWLEGDDVKDQFVKVRVAGGGQDAHPAAHPTVHVFGSHRKTSDGHPQQASAGQVVESGWWFFAAFAEGAGRCGRLFASIMVHGRNAPIDGTQFDAGTFNRGLI
jgi:hypothetical protein